MFTGIVKGNGTVLSLIKQGKKSVLQLRIPAGLGRGLKQGDSIAVNGACLTARQVHRDRIRCDLLRETLRRTNLGDLRVGSRVNLELSLRASDRLGGHFLLGHVDATGKIARWERRGRDQVMTIAYPAKFSKYLVPKGSIGVDGVSLTVVAPKKKSFQVHLIPHTLKSTTLNERRITEKVNLEFDILAKYLWKWKRRR